MSMQKNGSAKVRTRLGLSMVVVMVLSACSTGANYKVQPPQPAPPATFDQQQERFRAAEPVVAWWEQLSDKQLDYLVTRALDHNHDVRIAVANLREARALYGETRFDRFPTVEFEAQGAQQRLSDGSLTGPLSDRKVSSYEAGLVAVWELDLYGQVDQRIAAARAGLEAGTAGLHDTYVAVGAEVARTYAQLRGAQYRLSVAQRNADNQRQTFQLIRDLAAAGRSDELDIQRAKTQLALTRSTIAPLEAQVHETINRLGVLTGLGRGTLHETLGKRRPLPSIPAQINIGNPLDLLQRRPDLRRVERQLAAAVAQYNINVANLYPQVSLRGGLGFLATSLADLGSAGTTTALFGPQISWSAFDIGRVKQQIRAADARVLARVAAFEQTVLQALAETDSALTNFSREEQRRASLLEAAVASAKAAAYARERFDSGMDSFLDVLDAERTLLEAQDRLAQSETEMVTRLIDIYRALGGGWQGREVAAR